MLIQPLKKGGSDEKKKPDSTVTLTSDGELFVIGDHFELLKNYRRLNNTPLVIVNEHYLAFPLKKGSPIKVDISYYGKYIGYSSVDSIQISIAKKDINQDDKEYHERCKTNKFYYGSQPPACYAGQLKDDIKSYVDKQYKNDQSYMSTSNGYVISNIAFLFNNIKQIVGGEVEDSDQGIFHNLGSASSHTSIPYNIKTCVASSASPCDVKNTKTHIIITLEVRKTALAVY